MYVCVCVCVCVCVSVSGAPTSHPRHPSSTSLVRICLQYHHSNTWGVSSLRTITSTMRSRTESIKHQLPLGDSGAGSSKTRTYITTQKSLCIKPYTQEHTHTDHALHTGTHTHTHTHTHQALHTHTDQALHTGEHTNHRCAETCLHFRSTMWYKEKNVKKYY